MSDSDIAYTDLKPNPGATFTPIGITAAQVAAMSPGTRETAKAIMLGAHADPEQVAALFATPADKTAAAPVITYEGASPAETAKGLQYALDHGNPLLRDQVLAEAARQKIQLRGADGAFLPGADGSVPKRTYEFNVANLPGIAETSLADTQALLAKMSDASAALDLPDQIAQQALDAFIRGADVYDDTMSPEAVEARMGEQGRTLEGLSDGKNILRLAALGEKQFAAAHPDFYKSLRDNGAMLTVQSQIALAAIGSHIERNPRTK
jgi:hypothetical protein